MRPVNLIPVEERHGEHAPMRTGPVPYLLAGALVAALIGVSVLVLTGNQIADSKAEVAQLERADAAAGARAERLAPYTQFRSLQEQRVATVRSLADSRFDWERVMRELSLILPDDAWLVNLEATASPEASSGSSGGEGQGGGGSGSSLRGSIPGPALDIIGCASGQDAVAGFVTALKDVDGVTRVGVQSSELAEKSAGSAGGEDCRTRDFIAKFEIVVAFDAAPVVPSGSVAEAPVEPPAESTEAASTEAASTESSEGG